MQINLRNLYVLYIYHLMKNSELINNSLKDNQNPYF